MSQRTLILLGLVFVILLGFTVLLRNQPPPQPTIEDADVVYYTVFSDFTAVDIQAVRLQDPNSERALLLNRAPFGAWTTPEIIGTFDPQVGENIARTLEILPYSRTVEIGENATMADFGFAPNGLLLVQILLMNGDSHVIAVGGLTPTQDSYYALIDERPEVYVLQRAAVDFLQVQLFSSPIS